ncbi:MULTISPECIES: carbonic anhydrase [Sulfurospirillum]|uniref:carbonic anhydrase n=1 Tax=Sulfurospirillum TaxID=57665 RepID=UPI00054392BE|nr:MULTISPECIES: carbonic anhydrase [Sulfurospirillum]KHG34419.1 MAG: carbonic anhydrase [Sulfurospirillum sp. MES]MCD8545240.1 carbonic anhydrase [Sulfurospirillum cavolei]MCP3650853.1 carbonic anhydrase [Sulfurospirillum sp. DNRA8]MCR1809699.1 carbonic anhydrase [Sulfurospirillum sp. DNRA8]
MKIADLISGYEKFKDTKFKKYENKFIDLVKNGQKPKVLFIACSDSRVDPTLITDAAPGELFVLRNIGNFVPPFAPDDDYHATAAGIEYAVSVLGVSDIIVCGHSHCGAIETMYTKITDINLVHVKKWLQLGLDAKNYVEAKLGQNIDHAKRLELTEKISLLFQSKNLLTYPDVERRVNEGELFIRSWYYHLETGELEYFNTETGEFEPMLGCEG